MARRHRFVCVLRGSVTAPLGKRNSEFRFRFPIPYSFSCAKCPSMSFTLYYAPGACSLSPSIAMREAGIEFDLVRVDLRAKKLPDGGDYLAVNPKGYVPALRLANGEILTEGAVMVQYIADQKPESGLAPKAGTMERYRLMECLNFIAAEMHKQFGALFNPKYTPEMREVQLAVIGRRLKPLEEKL